MDPLQLARKGRDVILRVLPPEPVFAAYHRLARRRFLDYSQRKLGVDFKEVAPGASPPRALVAKTSASNERQLQLESNPDKYFGGGYRMVLNWLRMLEHISFNIRTVGAVLELGCGTARLIRHFRCMDGVRLVGTDLNPEMIEWCNQNVPGIEFYCNDLEPPLPLAGDAAFDLILASSVFTHIPRELQRPWLREMRRLLHPSGVFLCTVLGGRAKQTLLGPKEYGELAEAGYIELAGDDTRATLATQVGGSGWDVFQSRGELIRTFGEVFRIVDFVPGTQDLLVLQRPDAWAPLTAAPYSGEVF
jgi:SAM-dependent methyltransferase